MRVKTETGKAITRKFFKDSFKEKETRIKFKPIFNYSIIEFLVSEGIFKFSKHYFISTIS